jgi:hypothetical protein
MPDDPDTLLAQAAEAIRRTEEWLADNGNRWVGEYHPSGRDAHRTGALPLMRVMEDAAEAAVQAEPHRPGLSSFLCREIIRVAKEICGGPPLDATPD